jgi:hypothetical protein
MAAGLPTDGWKMSVDDYLRSAITLFQGVQWAGICDPIPVDPSGELLGGAHRLACALAIGMPNVPIERRQHQAWAPEWGYRWFVDNGMGEDDLKRLRHDWREMTGDPCD